MLSARLQIYAKSAAINSYGESELTTAFLRYIRAEELYIKLEESGVSNAVKPLDKYKFKVRWNTWLTEEHEIVLADGGVLTIDSIEPAGHQLKQWLIINATRQS